MWKKTLEKTLRLQGRTLSRRVGTSGTSPPEQWDANLRDTLNAPDEKAVSAFTEEPFHFQGPSASLDRLFNSKPTFKFDGFMRRKIAIFIDEFPLTDLKIATVEGFISYLWHFQDTVSPFNFASSDRVAEALNAFGPVPELIIHLLSFSLFRGCNPVGLTSMLKPNVIKGALHDYRPTDFGTSCLLHFVSTVLGTVNDTLLEQFFREIQEKAATGNLEAALQSDTNFLPFLLFLNHVMFGVLKKSAWEEYSVPEILAITKRYLLAMPFPERMNKLVFMNRVCMGQTTFLFQELTRDLFMSLLANQIRRGVPQRARLQFDPPRGHQQPAAQ